MEAVSAAAAAAIWHVAQGGGLLGAKILSAEPPTRVCFLLKLLDSTSGCRSTAPSNAYHRPRLRQTHPRYAASYRTRTQAGVSNFAPRTTLSADSL